MAEEGGVVHFQDRIHRAEGLLGRDDQGVHLGDQGIVLSEGPIQRHQDIRDLDHEITAEPGLARQRARVVSA